MLSYHKVSKVSYAFTFSCIFENDICLDDRDKHVCFVEFFLKYRCNHMFAWIFLCLCCYLGYDMYDSNMLEFMLCHDRCMIRSFWDD